ncbi:hypothetical protein RSOLAG1IB_03223 [Rhizoctonia solani AG-1 IB]|uniref:RBR-type E3 ubiquitin transferase n=1 Tax=Thanatephorus cucumeris (strain AG1-IB / isolate 7/3/14) TaxID=1108050 RepID=A0A0B7FNM5_THACB|nr:hypothetical protein RSOLAG1IB_03223 [Rhizoctonia solani AG-1 IB]
METKETTASSDRWRYNSLIVDPRPESLAGRSDPYFHYSLPPSAISHSSIPLEAKRSQQGPKVHAYNYKNSPDYYIPNTNYLRTHSDSSRSSSAISCSSSAVSNTTIPEIAFLQPQERYSLPFIPESQRNTLVSLSPNFASRDHDIPTCSICLENSNEFPQYGPASQCMHAPIICTPCLEEHISHSVLTDGLTLITCPVPDCRQILEYEDVLRGAKGHTACLNRYEALLLRRLLENDPNFVWCKNSACDWGQIHEGGVDNPLVICEECNAQSCFAHDMPWHTGSTCAEFSARTNAKAHRLMLRRRRRREEYDSEEYIQNNTKKCPNQSCGRRIQKNGGCNHMVCRFPAGCGHEFCWLCLADYGGPHRPGCEYYAHIFRIID